jgi:hypothetical protein
MPEMNNTDLEVFKTCLTLFVLAVTWLVGSQIINFWEGRKKRKEQDILSSSEFHKLFGEFTSVWRLWKVQHDRFPTKESLSDKAEERYWDLLKRASAVEGGMESIFVKLASEKRLSDVQINALGYFRQAIQQLRQSIRDFDKMDWQRENQEYILLKDLAIITAQLINKSSKIPKNNIAKMQLSKITEINSNQWNIRVGKKSANA